MTYTIRKLEPRQFLETGFDVSIYFDFWARIFLCSGHHMITICCKASYVMFPCFFMFLQHRMDSHGVEILQRKNVKIAVFVYYDMVHSISSKNPFFSHL